MVLVIFADYNQTQKAAEGDIASVCLTNYWITGWVRGSSFFNNAFFFFFTLPQNKEKTGSDVMGFNEH